MKPVLCIILSGCSIIVLLLPIGFWGFLNWHYGRIPAEATLFGLDLRTALVCVSGAGLISFLLSIGALVFAIISDRNR